MFWVPFHTGLTLDQPNILVEDSGCARIADFGLAKITRDQDSILNASQHHCGTLRWAAPEVLSRGRSTEKADIFSFAMVMIEVHRG